MGKRESLHESDRRNRQSFVVLLDAAVATSADATDNDNAKAIDTSNANRIWKCVTNR